MAVAPHDLVHVDPTAQVSHALVALGLLHPQNPSVGVWTSEDHDLFAAAAFRMTEVMTYGESVPDAVLTRWETAIIAIHKAANAREPGIWPPRLIPTDLLAPTHWGLRWVLTPAGLAAAPRLAIDRDMVAAAKVAEQELSAILTLFREHGLPANWPKESPSPRAADRRRYRRLTRAATGFPRKLVSAMELMRDVDWLSIVALQIPAGTDLPLPRAANDR